MVSAFVRVTVSNIFTGKISFVHNFSVTIPVLPPIPIPSLPSLPTFDLPKLPSLPKVSLPDLPNIPGVSLPEAPALPSLPNLSFSIPTPSLPSLPTFDLPKAPSLPIPKYNLPPFVAEVEAGVE